MNLLVRELKIDECDYAHMTTLAQNFKNFSSLSYLSFISSSAITDVEAAARSAVMGVLVLLPLSHFSRKFVSGLPTLVK
jgi:hypothetical protein